jgi:hypothetical protein
MIKVTIVNEVNGREFAGEFPSSTEAQAWINKQVAKNSWGKPERTLLKSEVPVELESRITSLVLKVEEQEVDGELVEVEVEYAILKPDYVITQKNLNLSKLWRNDQKRECRRKEYKSIEEVLHIILDHGLDSQEFADLQAERAAIKAKYPLE